MFGGQSSDSILGNWNAMNTRTNGDDEYVRKLNPNLVDVPTRRFIYGGTTQHRREKRNDICG